MTDPDDVLRRLRADAARFRDEAASLDDAGFVDRALDAIGAAAAMDPADAACPDCAVPPGEPHQDGCDVAQCLWTGRQRLMCPRAGTIEEVHQLTDGTGFVPHNCGRDVWTGRWPGEAECEEFGFALTAGLPSGRFVPDLNRLFAECQWDRTQARWVRRAPDVEG